MIFLFEKSSKLSLFRGIHAKKKENKKKTAYSSQNSLSIIFLFSSRQLPSPFALFSASALLFLVFSIGQLHSRARRRTRRESSEMSKSSPQAAKGGEGGGQHEGTSESATVAAHPFDFHVCGPRNFSSPNWRDLIRSTWFSLSLSLS